MYSKFTVLTVVLTLGLITFSGAKEEVDSSSSTSRTPITSLQGTVATEPEPQYTTVGTEEQEPEPQYTAVGMERQEPEPEPEPQDTAVSELTKLLKIVKILFIFLLWKMIPLLQFVGILFATMGSNVFTLIGIRQEPRWYRSILVKYVTPIFIGLYIVLPTLLPHYDLNDLLSTYSMPLARPSFVPF